MALGLNTLSHLLHKSNPHTIHVQPGQIFKKTRIYKTGFLHFQSQLWPHHSHRTMNDNDAKLTKLDELGELSDDEQSDRLHLERKVERAFYEAGRSLAEIRDRRLFRSTHQTFGEYCRERFCFTQVAASYKIAAAKVVDNGRVEGEYYLSPLSVRSERAIFTALGSRQTRLFQPCPCGDNDGSFHEPL